jgi:signal transduction histidine kinase
VALEEEDRFARARFDRVADDLARSHEETARQLRARDHFLATLAHELRTPLNAILGYARMLRRGQLRPEDHDRAFSTIEQSALAQGRLIADVMEAARVGEGKMVLHCEPLDLAALVERQVFAARPTAAARGVGLKLRVGRGPHVVDGDASRLAQAVSNLLSNALKFTPGAGLVTVSLEVCEGDALLVVSDTGEGIAPQALPHLFERFWQADDPHARSRGGLGLGLSIVRDVVELHGGGVRAESAGRGHGATFTLTLPVHAESRSTSAVVSPQSGVHRAAQCLGLGEESLGGIGSAAPRRG